MRMRVRMTMVIYHSLYWSFHWAFHPSGTLGGGGPGGGVAPKSFIVIAVKERVRLEEKRLEEAYVGKFGKVSSVRRSNEKRELLGERLPLLIRPRNVIPQYTATPRQGLHSATHMKL
jgi:hypothetical protein